MQRVRPVRTVLHVIATEPLGGSGAVDVEYLRRLAVRQARVFDFLPDFWRRARLGMNACDHAVEDTNGVPRWIDERGEKSAISSSSTALARNNAMLLRGT